MRVVVVEHLSLDGVLQGPGRAAEDTRDGFRLGGWAAGDDPDLGAAIGERLGSGFTWLLGRVSYDDVLGHWNEVGGPFKDGLNGTLKRVATRDPARELPWPNSVALSGDVPAEVARLREQPGGNLVVMGSGELVRSLLPRGLVDELLLMVHPIVLGAGRRLFGPQDAPLRLALVRSTTTRSGVVVSRYGRPPGKGA